MQLSHADEFLNVYIHYESEDLFKLEEDCYK